MKALYRKYRPVKLAEVVGQEQVTTPLANSIGAGKVNHAYLFVGPRGCGKTSVARILAHEVNGFDYQIEDEYVDIIEIDGASNRGIDNIRELREKVAIAPTAGKYKVYIIDEVHMLTKEAFNALLKTLEEPPEHAIFIMATTDAYKVPVTITSRAQTYTFKLAESKVMQAHLRQICEQEGIKITDAALGIVVRRGGGSFRDSLSLLDQISTLSDGEISEELVISAMGLPNVVKITTLFEDFISGDVVKITTDLKELLATGIKAETLVEEMIGQIVAEPRPELLSLLARLPEVKAPYAEAKLIVALCNSGELKIHSPSGRGSSGPSSRASDPSLLGRDLRKPSDEVFPSSPNLGTSTQKEPAEPLPRALRSATARELTPAARSDGPDGRGPRETGPEAPMGTFDWGEFVEKVGATDKGIAAQLSNVRHEVSGDTLEIYPDKSFVYKSLSRDKNKAVLIENAGGLKVVIHEIGAGAPANKDALISKMSDIMGGEVVNDGGDNPF